jgi:hypothetical protein
MGSGLPGVAEDLDLRKEIALKGNVSSELFEFVRELEYQSMQVPEHQLTGETITVLDRVTDGRMPILWQSPTPRREELTTKQRILCVIYTTDQRNEQIEALLQAWGRLCDGFIATSNTTEPSISAMEFPKLGPERYQNIWQKVRSTLWTLHAHARSEFDWVFVCGDDVFLLMDNLRSYLDSPEIRRAEGTWGKASREGAGPVFAGSLFESTNGFFFNHGGPGYLLNRAAMDALVGQFERGLCFPHAHVSSEDIVISMCMFEAGTMAIDTYDARGSPRFHVMSPLGAYFYHGWPSHIFTEREGIGDRCCARDSVSFGDVKDAAAMRLLDYYAFSNR